jgi:hypothetical protein
MKAYVITTGVIFGLLTLAHVLRIIGENRQLATDPAYMAITLVSAAMCIWAWYAVRHAKALPVDR